MFSLAALVASTKYLLPTSAVLSFRKNKACFRFTRAHASKVVCLRAPWCPGEDLNLTDSVQVVALFSKELATFSSPHETVPRTVSSLGKRKSALLRDALFLKCPGEDLNLHTLRHIHLKDTCIPISPPGHYLFSKWRHYVLLA